MAAPTPEAIETARRKVLQAKARLQAEADKAAARIKGLDLSASVLTL